GLEFRQRSRQRLLRGHQRRQPRAQLHRLGFDLRGFRLDLLLEGLLTVLAAEDGADGARQGMPRDVRALRTDLHAGLGDSGDVAAVDKQLGTLRRGDRDLPAFDQQVALGRDFGLRQVVIAGLPVAAVDGDVDAVADADVLRRQLLAGLRDRTAYM